MMTLMFKISRYGKHDVSRGFALPTILISSIVMLIVLLSSVSAASSVRTALDEQYYNRLAVQAAESGQERADACLEANNYVITWTDSSRLRPDTTCTGATISGATRYITENTTMRTTFLVWAPVTGVNGTAKVTVVGMTELLRSSSGTVYQTFSQTLVRTSGVLSNYSTDSASGAEETCGIVNQHTWCWGSGANGRLGNGTNTTSLTPVKVSRQPGLLEGRVDTGVAVGVGSACTVADAKVFCWGSNASGKLGNNSSVDSNVPVAVDTNTGMRGQIKQVVVGQSHACALTVVGDIYCWGQNDYGQLGMNSTAVSSWTPVRVAGIGAYAGIPVTKIATSHAKTTCAIATVTAGSRAYCWGRNDSGQVGDGTTTARIAPVPVNTAGVLSGKSVTDISLSSPDANGLWGHTCVVASGALYCWGEGSEGVLGNNSIADSYVPVAVYTGGVLSGKTALEVNVGVWHACATARNTSNVVSVHCWGQNDFGQLGSNQTAAQLAYSAVPVNVYVGAGGLQGETITGLKGGGNRGCVIADNTTYCWGYNYIGQLGDGTTTTRLIPTVAIFLLQTIPKITY